MTKCELPTKGGIKLDSQFKIDDCTHIKDLKLLRKSLFEKTETSTKIVNLMINDSPIEEPAAVYAQNKLAISIVEKGME